eukprot:CAMPEP_0171605568 /NCGR_PEP_ID=MMETSP0990-20121206/7267_1 /TAXON_ID=483369 /ORGANISM="non described non described, Strain CCMP2098" /LENGTH=113 /DNA_ID=CAMNT_0012168283 /DNA_START=714 /DNA_END=1055 /DNA_ORIENTATION=+
MKVLQAITSGDYAAYSAMCAEDITAIEPETKGHVVSGLPFHKHFFDVPASGDAAPAPTTTMANVNVRLLGDAAGVVSYNRLTQRGFEVSSCTETRVWEKRGGKWLNVHFHRSL